MRKEKVIVWAWKTHDLNFVKHEARAYIRKGWHRVIPTSIYRLFAEPDFEWAGTTKRVDWVDGDHLLEKEFGKDNEFLQYVRDTYNVDLEFEFTDLGDGPYRIGGGDYFEGWTHEGCPAEFRCAHPTN